MSACLPWRESFGQLHAAIFMMETTCITTTLGQMQHALSGCQQRAHKVCVRSGSETRAPSATLGPKVMMSTGVFSHFSTRFPRAAAHK